MIMEKVTHSSCFSSRNVEYDKVPHFGNVHVLIQEYLCSHVINNTLNSRFRSTFPFSCGNMSAKVHATT
jgi:hypothetical protein